MNTGICTGRILFLLSGENSNFQNPKKTFETKDNERVIYTI